MWEPPNFKPYHEIPMKQNHGELKIVQNIFIFLPCIDNIL